MKCVWEMIVCIAKRRLLSCVLVLITSKLLKLCHSNLIFIEGCWLLSNIPWDFKFLYLLSLRKEFISYCLVLKLGSLLSILFVMKLISHARECCSMISVIIISIIRHLRVEHTFISYQLIRNICISMSKSKICLLYIALVFLSLFSLSC